jgi:hypothetical protein
MPRRDARPLLCLAVAAVVFAATHSVAGLDVGWMMMAPALLLIGPLLGGRFPGEDTLRRWSIARRPRRRRPVATLRLPRPRRDVTAHGVLLAARAAGRAPPAAPA